MFIYSHSGKDKLKASLWMKAMGDIIFLSGAGTDAWKVQHSERNSVLLIDDLLSHPIEQRHGLI